MKCLHTLITLDRYKLQCFGFTLLLTLKHSIEAVRALPDTENMRIYNESNVTSYFPETTEGLTTGEGDEAALKYNDSELYVGFWICVLGFLFNTITSLIVCCCRYVRSTNISL